MVSRLFVVSTKDRLPCFKVHVPVLVVDPNQKDFSSNDSSPCQQNRDEKKVKA